tara:strand:- start:273 stop:524 length:252 start_codon:yes stop_codon:yes gene_type:complete
MTDQSVTARVDIARTFFPTSSTRIIGPITLAQPFHIVQESRTVGIRFALLLTAIITIAPISTRFVIMAAASFFTIIITFSSWR